MALAPQLIILQDSDIKQMIREVFRETKEPARLPIEWITPKQAKEFLNVKSHLTLNKIVDENNIGRRYRSKAPEISLADLIEYKKKLLSR